MAAPVRKDGQHFTYADYLNWPDDERWEIIDGVAYDMSPGPSPLHQEILIKLASRLQWFAEKMGGACRVYPAPFDVRLPKGEEDDKDVPTIVQPDISVVCDEKKIDKKGCRGAPDLVVEIVSPSTVKNDMTVKFDLYQNVGVPEYWVIHPGEQSVMIFKLNQENTYARPAVYTSGDIIEINLKKLFQLKVEELF